MVDQNDCFRNRHSISLPQERPLGRLIRLVKPLLMRAVLGVLATALCLFIVCRPSVRLPPPPLLSAVVGGIAMLGTFRLALPLLSAAMARRIRQKTRRWLERLGARRPTFLTTRQRDARLFRKLATLCRAGDLPYRQERVAALVGFMARKAGLDRAEQKLLADASTLHRTGFVSLPPLPGVDHARYTRLASDIAARLLDGPTRLHRVAIEMACAHDESWDGGGLPGNLVGLAIPYPARLLQVALALDALLPRNGRQPDQAALTAIVSRIAAESERMLDPSLAVLPSQHFASLYGLLASLPRPVDAPPPRVAAFIRWGRSALGARFAPMLTLA